ncbi:MAG TPA: rhodanese-like domain-containing protein [Myxococcales bacterium]|jgi:rhodanese-related sulfurtransferase
MGNRFSGHGLVIDGLVYLSGSDALPLLKVDAVLVDLREGLERNGREFDVAALINLPFRELSSGYAALPQDKPLVLADCVGLKSKDGVRFLLGKGYESVASLNGGMVDWEREGFPTIIDRSEELTGGCACQLKPRKDHRFGC